MKNTNEKHAELGYRTLLVHAQYVNKNMSAGNIEEVIVDLLSSLMHLDQEYGCNFDDMLLMAKDRFEADAAQRIANEALTKCPQCGGEADRGIDNCEPPSAYMCSKCCAQEEAEKAAIPPAGFILVYEGLRQDGDMRWSHFDQRWTLVYSDSMSKQIEDFDFPCARRIEQLNQ